MKTESDIKEAQEQIKLQLTQAENERENPVFKEIVKLAITPMISTLSLMENANSESEVLVIGISVIMLNLGMYLGVPVIMIVGIRKRL